MSALGPLNTMQIGELEVLSLFDGKTLVPATGAYQTGPAGLKGGAAADWEPHQDLLDDGMVEFVFGGFLIRGAGDRVMLVDGGVGALPDPQYGLGGWRAHREPRVRRRRSRRRDRRAVHAPPLRPHRLGVDGRRADVPERDLPLRPARLGSLRGFRRFRDLRGSDRSRTASSRGTATRRSRPASTRASVPGTRPAARSSCCRRAISARSCWATWCIALSSCSTTSGPASPTSTRRWRNRRATRLRASSRAPTSRSRRRTSPA